MAVQFFFHAHPTSQLAQISLFVQMNVTVHPDISFTNIRSVNGL